MTDRQDGAAVVAGQNPPHAPAVDSSVSQMFSASHVPEASPTPPAASAEPRSAGRRRKVHVGHFAFMRALVQGIEPKLAWEHYLRSEGQSHDIRLVRSTIGWIRDEFVAAARREDRHGTARLVRLDAARLHDPPTRNSPASKPSPKTPDSRTARRPSRSRPSRPATAAQCSGSPGAVA